MNTEKFKELCPLYFLNALDENELSEFKEELESGSEEIQKIYSAFQLTALHLPLAAEQFDPPHYVKEKILYQIRSKQESKKFNLVNKVIDVLGFRNPGFSFALTVILFAGLTTLAYFLYQKENTINNQQKLIVQLKNEVRKNDEMLKILAAKKIDVVIMNALEVNPAGYGKMVIDPVKKQAILQVSNLPETDKNKDYQLWVIKDKKPISNGVFAISDNNKNNYFMITNIAVQDIKYINAFAITLEPKGGVTQPTGKMYLVGNTSL